MKLSQLSNPMLKTTLEKLTKDNVPVTAAWKLKTIIKKANEELAKLEELRSELIKKHATKDASGQPVIDDKNNINVDPSNMDAFLSELSSLLNVDVEVGTIKVSELGSNVTLSVEGLMSLDGVVTE